MKLNDAVFGALFLLLSVLVLWTVQGYPKIPGQNVGPAAFPGAVAAVLAVCSVLLIVQGIRQRDRRVPLASLDAWTRSPAQVVAFGVTIAGLLLYVLASDRIGFLVTGIVLQLSLMLALRVKLVTAIVVSLIATFFIHFAFYKGLRVPLPWGFVPVLY